MATRDFDTRFDAHFPAPEPREHQRKAINHIVDAIEGDKHDVVLLDAPPGFGKSITLETALDMIQGKSYYLTPLKSLQQQLTEDDLIGERLTQVMGRANYECVLDDPDCGDTVDKGKCQKDSDFECPKRDVCPYYVKKANAIGAKKAVVNLAYFLNVPITQDTADGQFSPRDVLVIDECQSLEDWVIQNIGVTISKRTLPDEVYKNIDWPDRKESQDFDAVVEWLTDTVLPAVNETVNRIEAAPMLTDSQLDQLESCLDFRDRTNRFLGDCADNHWVHNVEVDINKHKPNDVRITFEPVHVGRFLHGLVWCHADTIILSSATIPKGGWLSEVGLGNMAIKRLPIPSPFPVENRPIITGETVGKMNYSNREENMPKAVAKIRQIADHHSEEKGLVHCRGYNYIDMLRKAAYSAGYTQWFDNNVAVQDRSQREQSLAEWRRGDEQVFLSVNMAEGIDLAGDDCRWQVVLKGEFPNMQDERVDYRLNEMGDQEWYSQQAIIQLEQAYGRAVRSPEDEAVMYILDDSAVNLLRYNKDLFHDWFLEGVVDMAI